LTASSVARSDWPSVRSRLPNRLSGGGAKVGTMEIAPLLRRNPSRSAATNSSASAAPDGPARSGSARWSMQSSTASGRARLIHDAGSSASCSICPKSACTSSSSTPWRAALAVRVGAIRSSVPLPTRPSLSGVSGTRSAPQRASSPMAAESRASWVSFSA